jgi:NTE family protein
MVAHSRGEALDANGEAISPGTSWGGASFRLHSRRPALGPGSWRLALGSLARPYRYSPVTLVAGVLPDGPMSTDPIRETIQAACPARWAPHPNFWAVAVDYATGRRVPFGRADAPECDLADAIAASCAIPGFYHSVRIGERRYVDGGVRSTTNLDLLALPNLDLVICLSPTSSLHASAPRTLGERLAYAMRQASGRRLAVEEQRVAEAGPEVVVIQPTVHDLDVMGTNLMSRVRRHQVIVTAKRTVAEHLRESPVGERLRRLPPGMTALVRRPPGPPDSWPDFHDAARSRFKRDRRAA